MSVKRFDDAAVAYARHRPGYPSAAIDLVVAGGIAEAADVGAGTGIASRQLAERGIRVIAVEPNAAMRAQAEPVAGIVWRDGTGEATGLDDASVDLAAAFQAFHWFATPAALREFRRIARTRAALVQYERDEADAATRAYGDIVRAYALDDTERKRLEALAFFAEFPGARVTRSAVPFVQRLDLAGLLGRAASTSYLPKDGDAAVALRSDLSGAFARHAAGNRFALAMTAHVIVADW